MTRKSGSALRARLEQAVALLRSGSAAQAEALLRRLRSHDPDHPDVLHFLGMLEQQRGRTQVAIELLRRATTLAPRYTDALNNLGNLLKLAGELGEAESCYRRALAVTPNDANALCNLGSMLHATKDLQAAERLLRQAIEIAPKHVQAYNNLGNVLKSAGRTKEAIACYRAAVAYDPDHPDAPRLLGIALYGAGRLAEAREVYRDWLERQPDNVVAAHMLAACSGGETPARASEAYVKDVFDDMSRYFDEHLAQLDYRAPQLVAGVVTELLAPPAARLSVLDAGCGTGLCAAALRAHARYLAGVDLSAGMLARAAKLELYDALIEQELTRHLHAHEQSYDLIVSADTLCYFGDLEEVTRAAARALKPGGLLVFTLERCADPIPAQGFRLEPHGRYAHVEGYATATLERAGLASIRVRAETLRTEVSKPVAGLVISAQAPGAAGAR